MTNDDLISREEVLAGLPARRAQTLLFLIESRTAHLVARSRVEFSLTESAAKERDLAFLEAFALGNSLPFHPSIQHLERYASQWASLVPENPKLKAALFKALSQKYRFSERLVPGIRASFSLDEPAIRKAYQNQYKKPITTAFVDRLSVSEQLSWSASAIARRLESLPPFWIAALVTVALGLPQAFLALPIACASIGLLATLVLLLVLGAINIMTMACMAEAIGRSGDFRYGNAFIKQLTANYLGGAGSFILSLAVGIRVFLIALACYLGLSATMADFTAIPATIWAGLLFCAGLYLISRKSLNFTVTVMVMLAGINVSLLLLLVLLALGHLQPDNLLYFNFPLLSEGFHFPMLQQLFGVSLMLYFGHVYVGECAKLVLPRDPSAASLIWGSIAGTAFLTFLFCLWVVAINGAIAPQILATQSGTALEPLAHQIGPAVKVIGAVLVILLLGMAWIRSSSLLVNLAREWFPGKPRSLLILPCQQGRLILQPRGNSSSFVRLGITYLGLAGDRAKFRLDVQSNGTVRQIEIAIARSWDIKELLVQLPNLEKQGIELTLEVQSANSDSACVKVASSMAIAYEGTLETAANATSSKQTNSQQFWTYLKTKIHFLPLLIVFLLTESLLISNTQSFTNVLSFAGVLGNSLVGGIFPILLLVSSRRKGELIPNAVWQLLNHRWLLVGIYSFFLAILFLHGLFIWENLFARISAIGIACLSLVATLAMASKGAFAPRTVVELREEQGGRTFLNVTAGGKPKTAQVYLGYVEGEQHYQATTIEIPSLSSLHYAIFQFSTKRIEELKLWAHRNKLGGDSESLPALLEVNGGQKTMQFDLKLSGGKVLLCPLDPECRLKISLTNN
ncbi:MAG: hypothetical protein MUD14_11300 [Hydrococcus sp. Prado102]|jgi:hypothetical protein|nr:hypothetical protein [Hydrococcus sp. Prado102]